MTLLATAAKGLPAEVDGNVVLGASGLWTAGAMPVSSLSGFPNDVKQVPRGNGSFSKGAPSVLFEQILSGAAATIDTGANGIAATFDHLDILFKLRTNNAVVGQSNNMTLNNDSTAGRYARQDIIVNSTSVLQNGNILTTTWDGVYSPGSTADGNAFSYGRLTIMDYVDTTAQKHAFGQIMLGGNLTTGGEFQRLASWIYTQTTAISRITLTASAGQFITGSHLVIYGY